MVEPVSPARINFGWLVRLRFATVAGQALTIVGVRFGMNLEIPLPPLVALVAVALASNLACLVWARARAPQDWWLAAVMAFDVLTFSGLLYFTGGPENPLLPLSGPHRHRGHHPASGLDLAPGAAVAGLVAGAVR